MKNLFFASALWLASAIFVQAQGFQNPALQCNIPPNVDSYDYTVSHTTHTVLDMNGDGKPDLIDSENQATENEADVFFNGNQKYWRVYLNNGSTFSATPIQWNIPANIDDEDYEVLNTLHTIIDMNGDGLPDMVDSENEAVNGPAEPFMNGNQKYWKVYLNTGTGFAATAIQWNIPPNIDTYDFYVSYTTHTVADFNGDGKPDLIDSYDALAEPYYNGNQKYWKVYLNTGSGFSATAIQWNIPPNIDTNDYQAFYTIHTVIDFNNDGKPDLIDSENEAVNGPAEVFMNGNQKYWKVYLNTGSGFSPTAIQWNIPPNFDYEDYYVSHTTHTVVDFNGDGKPDLVDSENEAVNGPAEPFMNGNQKFWKVYLNTGNGFATSALQWNIPASLDSYDFYVYYTIHTVMDFNGDGKPDLIDSENEAVNGGAEPFMNGNQKYWKVYLNNAPSLAAAAFENAASALRVYPNPAETVLNFAHDTRIQSIAIYNLMGQEVASKQFGAASAQIDVSSLAPGNYLARVQTDTQFETIKIIKK